MIRTYLDALDGVVIVGGEDVDPRLYGEPPRPGTLREWSYPAGQVCLKRGDEMGRFLLGSTVVLLFPKDTLRFNPDWAPGRSIRMGEAMGLAEGPA